MKELKKITRLTCFLLLMILASVGVALTGAAPVLPKNRERMISREKTEQVDTPKDESSKSRLEVFIE
jgi:hypothetical protein